MKKCNNTYPPREQVCFITGSMLGDFDDTLNALLKKRKGHSADGDRLADLMGDDKMRHVHHATIRKPADLHGLFFEAPIPYHDSVDLFHHLTPMESVP